MTTITPQLARLCATCAHRVSHTPMMCGHHRDAAGRARLCSGLRLHDGACGPEAASWAKAGATGAHVIDFPKAGRFA